MMAMIVYGYNDSDDDGLIMNHDSFPRKRISFRNILTEHGNFYEVRPFPDLSEF